MTITKTKLFKKLDWALILTALGVIAAWTPFVLDQFSPIRLNGKLISIYSNLGKFKNEPKSLFLFKLSVVSLNQSFDLNDIDIDLKYSKNGWSHSTSINQRSTIFSFENRPWKLNVPQSSFLNNLSLLRKDEPEVGYIFTTTPVYSNDQINEIKFIFKSLEGKDKSIIFPLENMNSQKFLFDDSIWESVDTIQ